MTSLKKLQCLVLCYLWWWCWTGITIRNKGISQWSEDLHNYFWLKTSKWDSDVFISSVQELVCKNPFLNFDLVDLSPKSSMLLTQLRSVTQMVETVTLNSSTWNSTLRPELTKMFLSPAWSNKSHNSLLFMHMSLRSSQLKQALLPPPQDIGIWMTEPIYLVFLKLPDSPTSWPTHPVVFGSYVLFIMKKEMGMVCVSLHIFENWIPLWYFSYSGMTWIEQLRSLPCLVLATV